MMYIIFHVNDKGVTNERHERSTNGMLGALAEVATWAIANHHGFTYTALPLPLLVTDNGHRFYVERKH